MAAKTCLLGWIGVENWHFFALRVQILASNLDWKQVRGCATKICCCWNFDDAPCSDSVVVLWFSGKM